MDNRAPYIWLSAIAVSILLGWTSLGSAQEKSVTERNMTAGPFTFSDELGGHRIVSVSGEGSKEDPIVIVQKIETLKPSTITIRHVRRFLKDRSVFAAWTSMHLKFVTHNITAASWIGFRFELQEKLGKPSIYGDGLSFNQITRNDEDIVSDRFIDHSVEFEPGDRLVFENGWVNQREEVQFKLYILDLSPADIFYLVQVPQLPAS
jgi:hypothetical protein